MPGSAARAGLRAAAGSPRSATVTPGRRTATQGRLPTARTPSAARTLPIAPTPPTPGRPRPADAPDQLTGRELQILRLIAAGHSNRRVGEELSISGHTVANHVRSILRKTGACNRTEAAGYAFRHALIDRAADR